MTALLSYLIQMIAASGLFYGYYHFVLRNKKFHKYNRYYLLTSLVISLIVPLVNIPLYFTENETGYSAVLKALTIFTTSATNNITVTSNKHQDFANWLSIQNMLRFIYLIVLAVLFIRIAISLVGIRKIIKANPIEKFGSIRFVNTDEAGTPFSFFRWLFWNKQIELQSDKGEQIFRHELFHIEQKHSLDIISLEIFTAFFWFNPFFHLIKKEVKTIHEFLADEFATKENNRWQYAELLLMQVLNTRQSLVTPFFHNQIKRRIAMITTSKKTSHQYFRKIMVLPLVSISLLLFAFSYKKKILVETLQMVKTTNPTGNTDTTKPQKNNQKELLLTEITEAVYPGGDSVWRMYLMRELNANTPIKNKAPEGIYKVLLKFKISEDGSIDQLIPLSSFGYGIEEEVVRVIKKSLKWIPAKKNGTPTDSYKIQPILFQIGKGENVFSSPNINNIPSIQNEVVVIGYNESIEKLASFPGGSEKWQQYLQKNLRSTIPIDSGANPGIYKVVVQFKVLETGILTELKPITNHGYGREGEVTRIMKVGPKWEPAIENGKPVASYKQQPVTFVISEDPETLPVKNDGFPSISIAELQNATLLELIAADPGTEIIKTRLGIDMPNNSIHEVWNSGNNFGQAAKTLFRNAKAGHLFTLDDITIIKNGKEIKIPSKAYHLTN